MTIYYDSRTGNVERFVRKVSARTGWQCLKISEDLIISSPGHLITYTTKIGQVSYSTERFMQVNSPFILTISSSGNMNWGANFAVAADKIATRYGIPLLLKFELSGLERDVNAFIEKVNSFKVRLHEQVM
ncbi:class Ib ribonucleoside-diphosphate reductase assembly flavoprotein NrdI [Proteiniphilum acetatigenes]|uniref:class Ib ribonucleoside-diphosphate reductase assembly flavoprotein NrdI n=1 Tax=Proteiniphilum acetatigenes TaxID=294710 RepID=UPI0003689BE5|nr:class Ib ribonucleoside-diphosphate reductase assembly flavoprotein NrdI [Proteiniphilum acetatigenes]